MPTSFSVNDMTIHRIVEQEYGFTPLFEFLPTLSKEQPGSAIWSIEYDKLGPLALQGVKELKSLLDSTVQELNAKVAALEAEIRRLKTEALAAA